MSPLLLLFPALAFDPGRLTAYAFPATEQEPASAFATVILQKLGTVQTIQESKRESDPTEVRWTVGWEGTAWIQGVPCSTEAFSSHTDDPEFDRGGDDRRAGATWGCTIEAGTLAALGLPAGTRASFLLGTGTLRRLLLPEGSSLTMGSTRCKGELSFLDNRLAGCVLADAQTVGKVQLPRGTLVVYSPEGKPTSGEIPGRSVQAGGRSWGPDYTPCGSFYFRFAADGSMIPPKPDPLQETCCD
ncbi:MAG TPA: hypothetical protein PKY30_11420 [Myxococcota bacterium]|nr:hypothetical protein [Myxococcota bacterium]HNH47643.1 hypothetical protein [Myxococcota bacterium]